MSDKKFTIKPGDRVTIEINSSSKDQGPKSKVQSPNAKGLIRARREDDYLPRRKQENYIRLFDLGVTAEGVSNPAVLALGIDDDLNAVYDMDELSEFSADLNTSIFEIEDADKKTYFKRIDKGDTNYEKVIAVEYDMTDDALENLPEEKWTDKGLKLTADEAKTLVIKPTLLPGLFASSELDFAAADVYDSETDELVPDFELKPKAEIYLMPATLLPDVHYQYYDGLIENAGNFQTRIVVERFAFELMIFPRELLSEFAAIEFTGNYFNLFRQQADLFAQFPSGRAKRKTRNPAPGSGFVYTTEDIDPEAETPNATYFSDEDYIVINDDEQGNVFTASFTEPPVDVVPTKALIYQNGKWFYVYESP